MTLTVPQMVGQIFASGFSDDQIAAHLAVSQQAVYTWRTGRVKNPRLRSLAGLIELYHRIVGGSTLASHGEDPRVDAAEASPLAAGKDDPTPEFQPSGNYNTGKQGEADTKQSYLPRFGFVLLAKEQRANITKAFMRAKGLVVHKSGFDAVKADGEDCSRWLDSVDELARNIEKLRLYEVKTAGRARKAKITPGFKGLGFTLTSKERDNALALGSQYRFLFVNLKAGTHRECSLEDFFHEGASRIYPTWSVFLARDLADLGGPSRL